MGGERAVRELITGVWGRSHQRVQGQSPWSGDQGGEVPLKLKHFAFERSMKPQIRPFF